MKIFGTTLFFETSYASYQMPVAIECNDEYSYKNFINDIKLKKERYDYLNYKTPERYSFLLNKQKSDSFISNHFIMPENTIEIGVIYKIENSSVSHEVFVENKISVSRNRYFKSQEKDPTKIELEFKISIPDIMNNLIHSDNDFKQIIKNYYFEIKDKNYIKLQSQ